MFFCNVLFVYGKKNMSETNVLAEFFSGYALKRQWEKNNIFVYA